MFAFANRDNRDPFEQPIRAVLVEMAVYGPDSEEYQAQLNNLERLTALRDANRKSKPSPDTLMIVLGNLAAITIMVAYEQKHVLASKGLGFLLKPKTNVTS